MEYPKISVVMPAYNRAFMIRMVLDSLLSQTYPNFEVILVDDGSSDNTEDVIARCYKSDNRLKYIRQPNKGPSGARNTGIKNAAGEIILFIDSDVISPKGLFDIHYKEHLKGGNLIIQGQIIRIGDLADAFRAKFSLIHYSRSFFDTANVSVRKEHLDRVNGFDEVNFRKGWEDLDIGLRLLKAGLKVKRLYKQGAVWHFEGKINPDSIQDFFKDRYGEGRAAVAFYRKHPTFGAKMMTMAGGFFFWLDRVLFNENYLNSERYYAKIKKMWDGGKKDRAIASLRVSAYHFYLKGVQDRIREDGYILAKN